MTIRKCIFDNNNGLKEGGAISWFGRSPNIEENNIFVRNLAAYGANISSYPVKLGIEIFEKNGFKKIYSFKFNSSIAKLGNISSGNILPYQIIVYILDVYGQIVGTANGLF